MVRELVHDPMLLMQKAQPATKDDLQVIRDLQDTLQAHIQGCVGMAANMIGVKKNIIVVSTGFAILTMVNARIVKKTGSYQTEEGCLSFLGGPKKTTRYQEIEVEYQDVNFENRRGTFTGFTAQIIQHELDHVAGVLI